MIERAIAHHCPPEARPADRLAAIGLFLRRNRRLVLGVQWAIVVVYAVLVVVPAFLPLPPDGSGC